jgi:hypothetical protein
MKYLSFFGSFLLYTLLIGSGCGLLVAQDKKEETKKEEPKKEYVSPTLPGGVPVFQPGQDTKKKDVPKDVPKDAKDAPKKEEYPTPTLPPPVSKDEGPPPAVASDDGKMPLKFLKNKISDMKQGESGYIPVSAVMVDSQRACYVDPNAVVAQTPNKNAPIVQVKKDEKGYHLALNESAAAYKWHAEDDTKMKDMTQVKTVKVLPESSE